MATIKVPSLLKEDKVFPFIRTLWSFKDVTDLFIDYSDLAFAYPFGALVLSSLIRDFVRYRITQNLKTTATGIDKSKDVFSYLAHIGFFKYQILDFGNEPGQASGSYNYLPFKIITKKQLTGSTKHLGQAIQNESESLTQLLLQIDKPTITHPVTYCFRETIRNVFEHANTNSCFVCAQKYQNTRIEIAIIDKGRGIRASLEERYSFSNDIEAIQHSLLPGISRVDVSKSNYDDDPFANSGFGLYVLSRLAQKTGEFVIVSKNAGINYSCNSTGIVDYAFPGTAIKLNITKPTSVNLNDLIQEIIREGESKSSQYDKIRASKMTKLI